MSTSVAVLRKRLTDLKRYDLLDGIDRGLISTFAAACEAGICKRPEALGTGSPNKSKRIAFALSKITREAPRPALGSKPEPKSSKLEVSKSARLADLAEPPLREPTRDIIARLVAEGRTDLLLAVTERRISPFQAARIADSGRRQREAKRAAEQRPIFPAGEAPKPTKPKKPARPLDVRAIIG
jgi:hypothetical protein